MNHKVYVSFAPSDLEAAREIVVGLETAGFRCWHQDRDMVPGEDVGIAISGAIESARVVVLLESPASQRSHSVLRDILMARDRKLPILPIAIKSVPLSNALSEKLGGVPIYDASRGALLEHLPALVRAVSKFVPVEAGSSVPKEQSPARPPAKGYVFISYSRPDRPHIDRLKSVLKRRGYAYWDYSESDRNYHSALYRELEEKIERAAAFICLLSDGWRDTEWPAAEYLYAKEANIPIFVIQITKLSRPVPILLNQQTRIDMSGEYEKGVAVLENELEKKGL
jgi:hypothetical protein